MTFSQEFWFGIGLLVVGLALELLIDIARDKWRERPRPKPITKQRQER